MKCLNRLKYCVSCQNDKVADNFARDISKAVFLPKCGSELYEIRRDLGIYAHVRDAPNSDGLQYKANK